MERFDFFFGLHLGGRLHSHINNLSKDLQGTDWRLVLVHQATFKLPKITWEGSYWSYRQGLIGLIVSAIYHESFSSYAQMETLMVKAGNGDHYEAELKFLGTSYREDVDTGALPGHATEYFGSYVMGEDGCQCVLTKSCWRCQSFQNQKRS